MSTVDKGPSSRASDADELEEIDADVTEALWTNSPLKAASNGAAPADSAVESVETRGDDDSHPDSDDQESDADQVDYRKSDEPKPDESKPGKSESDESESESDESESDESESESDESKPNGLKSDSSNSGNSNRSSGPVDPGLAMVARSSKPSSGPNARKNGDQRSKKSSAKKASANREPRPAVVDTPPSESGDGGEQLVIVPVSDYVATKPDRPANRTGGRPADRTGGRPADRTGDRTGDRPQRRPKRPPTPSDRPVRPKPELAETEDYRTAPMPRMGGAPTSRGSNRRARVRRVTRVVRHIDPWSTFKAGLLFSLVTYVICLTSGVLLWKVADQTGTISNMQGWFTQFGWETFELNGDEIFQNAAVLGLFMAVGFTGLIVLGVTIFNLVSDIIGGIRISVLEEEVVERRVTTSRRYAVRRPGVGSNDRGASAADWAVDSETPKARRPAPSPLPSTTTNWSVED